MSWRALRYSFGLAGLLWMVFGIVAHNVGCEGMSHFFAWMMYACVAGALWAWVGRP